MGEIIGLHFGGAGIKVGFQFWSQCSHETRQSKTSVFYEQNEKQQLRARALFIDHDSRSFNSIRNSTNATIGPKNIVESNSQHSSCLNLFSEGRYSSGNLLEEPLLEKVRQQVEACDRFSSFIITSSASGGTGSGVAANCLTKLKDLYPAPIYEQFQILPGFNKDFNSNTVNALQTYNTILSSHYSIQNVDNVVCLENESVFNILAASDIMCTYRQNNKYLGRCLLEHVSPYQFHGPLNSSQRKRATNLLPFPRLKYLRASLSVRNSKKYLQSVFNYKRQLLMTHSRPDKRVFAMAISVRDPWAYEEDIYEKAMSQFHSNGDEVVEWIPHATHLSIIDRTHDGWGASAWSLVNGTENIGWIRKLSEYFTTYFRRKAFLYHYTSQGMDEMQFTEAESNCNDIISEYTPYTNDYYMQDDDDQ